MVYHRRYTVHFDTERFDALWSAILCQISKVAVQRRLFKAHNNVLFWCKNPTRIIRLRGCAAKLRCYIAIIA